MSGKKNKAVWLVAGIGVLFVLLTGILYVGAKTKGRCVWSIFRRS